MLYLYYHKRIYFRCCQAPRLTAPFHAVASSTPRFPLQAQSEFQTASDNASCCNRQFDSKQAIQPRRTDISRATARRSLRVPQVARRSRSLRRILLCGR